MGFGGGDNSFTFLQENTGISYPLITPFEEAFLGVIAVVWLSELGDRGDGEE